MKTTITTFRGTVIVAFALFTSAGILSAQNLVNGSFELGTDPGSDFSSLFAVDSTTIAGWTVSGGTVDYIGGRWAAQDGSRSIDMNGNSAGTLTQNVSGFTSGQGYRLFFYLAASPDAGAGASRTLQVNVATASQDFTALGTGLYSNPGWGQQHLDFTANSSTLALSFVSLASGDWGPLLDNVSIAPVPEPGILSLGIMTAGLAGFARWKRVQAVK